MITVNRKVNEHIKRGEEKWMKLMHADNFLGKIWSKVIAPVTYREFFWWPRSFM